ncbi:MAG: polymer-forming cytoskeletal [Akkermansiaceae bacterium]|nr:polymer-forming cytoskeletal [Akkermansiaceae bacterium]
MSNPLFSKITGQKPAEEPTAPPAPAPVANYGSTPAPASVFTSPAPAAPASSPLAAAAPRQAAGVSRNVLSSDVDIKGTVKFTNDLVVDGKIEGEIQSEGNLVVGENARLKAEIKTATVVVYGKVHGNITATDRVELKASAEVVGDIKAKTLSMEPGSIFVGKSAVGTPSTPAAATKPAATSTPAATPASTSGGKPDAPKQGDLAGVNP